MSPDDDSVVDHEYVLRFAGASGMVEMAGSEQHLAQGRTMKAPPIQPPEGVHPTLFEYLKAFQGAGTATCLPQGNSIAGNFCNSDMPNPCPFQPLQIAQQAPAVPDLALFRPPIPPVWSTDESESTSYTQGTSYTSPLSGASSSTGPGPRSVDGPMSAAEPLFELGPPQNKSPLNDIDDIRKLFHMDMDALMRTVPSESPASMDGRAGLTSSQSNPSPPSVGNNPSTNDSPLDWDNIFAMQAPSMHTSMPEQGWENFLTNGWS